jgi:hypothetical protein
VRVTFARRFYLACALLLLRFTHTPQEVGGGRLAPVRASALKSFTCYRVNHFRSQTHCLFDSGTKKSPATTGLDFRRNTCRCLKCYSVSGINNDGQLAGSFRCPCGQGAEVYPTSSRCQIGVVPLCCKWAIQDLNLRPLPYQRSALTN